MFKDDRVEGDKEKMRSPNVDPISGEAGAHPLGTGIGAATGGAAGAAIGAAAGPVGALVGAGVGAIAGGFAGHSAAEAVNPTAEDDYWRDNFHNRPYVEPNESYDDYRPAYQLGWESFRKYGGKGRSFEEVEDDIRREWERRKTRSPLTWDRARPAIRDAWDRVEHEMPA